MERKVIVEMALREAVRILPSLESARHGSTPDDSNAAGYFADNDDGILEYTTWFRAGDIVGEKHVKPF